jgi:hypothetical protein
MYGRDTNGQELSMEVNRYYQNHKDNWDYYYVKQDICPISRTLENKGRSCPMFLQNLCIRREKGSYTRVCRRFKK